MDIDKLVIQTGIPTSGAAGVRIGDGPMLTEAQLRDVLIVAGHPEPDVAAKFLAHGTARTPIVRRTAQDWMNEQEARELRETVAGLRDVLRKKLPPRKVQALDLLTAWRSSGTLAKAMGVSQQHASNLLVSLHDQGLVTRKPLPSHLGGYLYSASLLWRSSGEVV